MEVLINAEEKVRLAKIKFNNRYLYSNYIGKRTIDKVTIVCPTHGKFDQEARIHLKSIYGCPKCASTASGNSQRKSQDVWVKEATVLHKGKYSYTNTVYTGDSNKLSITCSVHGDFLQVAGSHLRGCGCPRCGDINTKLKQRLSIVDLRKQLTSLKSHITVDVLTYVSAKTRMVCKCEYHGPFKQTLEVLRNPHSKGCPKCANENRGWKRSIYENTNVTLYILKLKNGLYKVGITKNTLNSRYGKDMQYIRGILYQHTFTDGVQAWDIEKLILRKLCNYKFKGEKIFKYTGNSEILTINPTSNAKRIVYEYLRLLFV